MWQLLQQLINHPSLIIIQIILLKISFNNRNKFRKLKKIPKMGYSLLDMKEIMMQIQVIQHITCAPYIDRWHIFSHNAVSNYFYIAILKLTSF